MGTCEPRSRKYAVYTCEDLQKQLIEVWYVLEGIEQTESSAFTYFALDPSAMGPSCLGGIHSCHTPEELENANAVRFHGYTDKVV